MQAIALMKTDTMSWRQIAKVLDVSKSTVSDFLRGYCKVMDVEPEKEVEEDSPVTWSFVDGLYGEQDKSQGKIVSFEKFSEELSKGMAVKKESVTLASNEVFKIVTDQTKQEGTHLFIPDTQCKPDISLDYLRWLGEYIVRKKPDVIVHAGDHADMESLSGWDKGKKAAEGKRIHLDVTAAIAGMRALLQPLYNLQQQELKEFGEVRYKPRMTLTLGNHEDRIDRYAETHPEMHGFLSVDNLKYKEFGWEVVKFLTPIEIGGIFYAHYFQNVMTGKPLGGNAAAMLKVIGKSYSCGHRQTLDIATRSLQVNGQQQWGLQCGAFYEHQEGYKGFQGNFHFRGVVVKHNVKGGSYDLMLVSSDWLKAQYGK